MLPAARGRILARDGTVLACDRTIHAVAVEYRWLQEPPDARWLRSDGPLAAAEGGSQECRETRRRAGDRVGRTRRTGRSAWPSCAAFRPSNGPPERGRFRPASNASPQRPTAGGSRTAAEPDEADDSWAVRIRRLLLEDPPPPRIVVAEELAPHVVAEDVPPAVVAEIKNHADRYPGTKIVELARRTYPARHAGRPRARTSRADRGRGAGGATRARAKRRYLPDDLVGRMGVERQYEAVLRGQPRRGRRTDRPQRPRRHVLSPPGTGRRPRRDADARRRLAAHGRRTAAKRAWNGGRSRAGPTESGRRGDRGDGRSRRGDSAPPPRRRRSIRICSSAARRERARRAAGRQVASAVRPRHAAWRFRPARRSRR